MGDSFIHEIYEELQNMKKTANSKNKQQPYMYDQYNVKIFCANPLSNTRNVVMHFLNVFIKSLSNAKKMPKIVIFVPDWDILQYLNFYENGAREMTARILSWVVTNATRVVQSKKDSLSHRKPGAVSDSQPKMLWVKMINRHGEFDRALTARVRFNCALEDTIAGKKLQFILDVNQAVNSANCFGPRNLLNGDGMLKFWHEIDGLVKIFDADESQFIPRKTHYSSDAQNYSTRRASDNRHNPHWNDRHHTGRHFHSNMHWHRKSNY